MPRGDGTGPNGTGPLGRNLGKADRYRRGGRQGRGYRQSGTCRRDRRVESDRRFRAPRSVPNARFSGVSGRILGAALTALPVLLGRLVQRRLPSRSAKELNPPESKNNVIEIKPEELKRLK